MVKSISVLGSTGSIGVQALDVARSLKIKVVGLSAYGNIDLLEKQAYEFRPGIISVGSGKLAEKLSAKLQGLDIRVCSGPEGLKMVAAAGDADIVVNAIVGIAGLLPTLEAIRHGRDIALANKETLVTAGSIVMAEAKKNKINILPVDSEHSAVFQCIHGKRKRDISKIILTASGGPFRGITRDALNGVSVGQALNHPKWSMGKKITIDSATLMNKGLEIIEAKWFFGLPYDKIQVLVHPQSIVHSMVEYVDGSVIAQLGCPDMRIPLQFALTYPNRLCNDFPKLDFAAVKDLTFEEPDFKTFPCIDLAYKALEAGGTMPAVLNGANEVVVSLFLAGNICFAKIPIIIERVMERHNVNTKPCLDDILEADRWAREQAIALNK